MMILVLMVSILENIGGRGLKMYLSKQFGGGGFFHGNTQKGVFKDNTIKVFFKIKQEGKGIKEEQMILLP